MKKIIFVTLLILGCTLMSNKNYIIPNDSIRFRIIPNSNSREDIIMKEKATKEVLSVVDSTDLKNIDSSRDSVYNSIKTIEDKIDTLFEENNYNKSFKVNYGLNEFPKKIYKGVEYEEGYYESLVVEIGETSGNNYWCVLYPPLCLIDETDISYKSKVIEIIDRFF